MVDLFPRSRLEEAGDDEVDPDAKRRITYQVQCNTLWELEWVTHTRIQVYSSHDLLYILAFMYKMNWFMSLVHIFIVQSTVWGIYSHNT